MAIKDFLDSITNDENFKNNDDEVLNLTDRVPSNLTFSINQSNNQDNMRQYLNNLTSDDKIDSNTGEVLTAKNRENVKIPIIDKKLENEDEEGEGD